MFALDLRSLNLMAFMTSAAMGFVLLMLRRHYPGSIRGMLLWGLAPLVAASSTVFYGIESLPPLVTLVFGNGLLMAGCALFYFGTRRFYGLGNGWRLWAAVGVLVLLWQVFFFAVRPDYRLRLSAFATTLAVVLLLHVRLLLQRRGRGFAARFTAGVLLVQALVLLARAVSTFWLDTPGTHRFTPSPVQSVYVATFSFSVLLVSVGVLLMASERLRSQFEHLANHDSLTGALARRVVLEDGTREFGRWQRFDHGFALLMVDVDHFKRINDAHGHAVGDRVLARMVDALRHALRAIDRLGRYGGEEFLVLLPETGEDEARTVAERMRQAVARLPATAQVPACTISVGVACVRHGDASLDAVLARADAALYEAKRLGRNRVVVAEGA